jgi:ribose 5-phosphate isomerase A
VDTLGAFPLPVEIIPISLKPVTKALNDMGGEVAIRMGEKKDGPVITDNGNFILDVSFGRIENPIEMEEELNTIPGVVENGLFTQMVDKVIIGSKDGVKYL